MEEEWKLIFEHAGAKAKVLMRSASTKIDFFPEFVKNQVQFDQQKANECHYQDRVGTYGSTYFGVISSAPNEVDSIDTTRKEDNEKQALSLA